ncbi:EH domain-containing protein 1 [Trichonephila clavata]|uniref:EH domain-containing protein 1 n=1 Tax=Trichonephila clavata TaxID=2740835 RepID=A0A8X6FUX7_TRICU|nr:EH domain-containing protein 1 [Trichonephila clavata]
MDCFHCYVISCSLPPPFFIAFFLANKRKHRIQRVHAYIISSLRSNMPSMFGKDNKKKELIKNLRNIYEEIQREHHLPPGDFPDLRDMQEKLMGMDFTKFQPLKPRLLDAVDKMLAEDIARLMAQIPQEQHMQSKEESNVKGGAFDGVQQSPFTYGRGEGVDAGSMDTEWIVGKERYKYDDVFQGLNPVDGKISGASAKSEMVKSKLPNTVLGKVWKLSDIDKDGMLDSDEFALAMHLINIKLQGHDLPLDLPEHLVPPSKKIFVR